MIAYLFGIITGLIVSEFLPADLVIKLGKIKFKNSDSNTVGIPANTLKKIARENGKQKRPGIFRKIFKRKRV